MQKINLKKKFLSPSQLIGFLNCNYHTIHNLRGTPKKEKTISIKALFKRGLSHEKDYLKKIKKNNKNVVEINQSLSNEDQEKQTQKAIKNGADLIYQGCLIENNWIGKPDFLIKKLNEKDEPYYEVTDTKISSQVKVDHLMQVNSYVDLLTKYQDGVLGDKTNIVLKNFKEKSFSLNETMNYFSINKEKYENFLNSKSIDKIKPNKCSYCQFCDYQDACKSEWEKKDSLNLVAGIQRIEIQALEDSKILTMHKLAGFDKKKKIEGIKDYRLTKIIKQAELQVYNKKTGENKYELFPVEPLRGFNRLPQKGSCDLFFDIEGAPSFVYEDGLQYLFGLHYIENDKAKSKFFWAHDREEEKQLIIDFLDFVTNHLSKYPDSYIFHYHNYEERAVKDLTSFHKVKMRELDNLLIKEKFVDLYKCVKESMQCSSESYSLKDIEKFYKFERSGDVKTASESVDYYVEYIETKDKKILDKIEKYNEEDVQSTMYLRNWLLDKARPDNVEWFTPTEQKEKNEESEDWEQTARELDEKIDKSKIESDLKKLLSNIQNYHRRENRPDWWAFRERRYKNTDELIDDAECLGGLNLIGEPEPIKQSLLYKYKFPEQEYKIKKGQLATNAQWVDFDKKNAGEIISIDAKKRILEIKKGAGIDRKTGLAKENLPKLLNLGPATPTPPNKLESSIQEFIKETISSNKTNKYLAILDILRKEIPNIKGLTKGENLVKTDNFEKEIPLVIENLDNSFVVLQGPPGTGKTFTIGCSVIHLLKKGRKIAISGNSHKVIINLLEAIEKEAIKQNFKFKGLKQKGSLEEHIFDGEFITTQYIDHKGKKRDNDDRNFIKALKENSHNLFAGTKYHLRKEFFDQEIDVLFIDEASQVSVADVVAMGKCAKNIVLVGDQQQLAMPSRAVHPGKINKSILEFLVEDDTISPDRGVFLNTTRRLHPNINNFTSNSFYDGRLKYHPDTEKRKIILPKSEKIFKDSGIYYLPMNHKNRSQLCEEEGQEIIKLYNKFLKGKFIDEKGKESNIDIDSILVISPYNVQVNYLKEILPKGANVGTVDSFQGQQRPISILSMTTSDPENLSRNLEFFYSRNRLNVGISRAQCISIILMNPELFHLQVKKPEQIKLVNTLIKLKDYKVS